MTTQRLQDEICTLLDQSQQCVISTIGEAGSWAVPALYQHKNLDLTCLIPRWADAAYHLSQNPKAVLTITQSEQNKPGWYIQYRGVVTILAQPDWTAWPNIGGSDPPQTRFIVVKVMPAEIELVDERKGWSRRELLKLARGMS